MCGSHYARVRVTASALAEMLREHAINSTGYLFATASGRPLSQRNVLRSLHSIVPVGLHAFRRYRTEVLRRAGCPEDLVRMWLGHAPTSVTDMYALGLQRDEKRRQEWCERVGLGFDLGYMGYKIAPQIEAETCAASAA